ncbi:MAG: ABC transporter ATP-binding protein [Alphaproteobacteria bacterium]|jgi:branched-chain amino acid transport system ATP-binding protein|nr:ABC transporter ATP-binding protein [Alphaproteobacteria bacterium]
MLAIEDLHVWYGSSHVIQGLSLTVPAGGAVALLGRNGAGKTTTLRAIMGLVARRGGRVRLDGRGLESLPPHRIARAGIAYVPESRGIFPSLSVLENLTVAARGTGWSLERVFETFPSLTERRDHGGGALSGGEQQMLAIARALMTNARLLILDEPTEGLAPLVVGEIETLLAGLKETGLGILLVEQNLAFATALADTVHVLGKGRIRWRGDGTELAGVPEITRDWLGV